VAAKRTTARHRRASYRKARDEYAAIRKLGKKNWIAAHIRERRYELELTQQEVADAAGTSHSYISRVEKGDHLPTLPVLARILDVLGDEVLLTIAEHGANGDLPKPAPVPRIAAG
jgi:DNA-binding XRE family transcriptional regulator